MTSISGHLWKLAWPTTVGTLVACSAATGAPEQEVDGPEPEVSADRSELAAGATVADVVKAGGSTASVKGLSEQIVAQMNCLIPNAMAAVPKRPNLTQSAATFPYLQLPARDRLVEALDANPGMTLGLNSMFRTVAQQYLLHQWGQKKTCGVALAAKPGSSNHESGLALDTSQHAAWRSALESRGFKWFGSKDKVHFDYVGPGKVSLAGLDVKAFQMLWNANHPEDVIAADGVYGPATGARLAKSPAAGFSIGATCGGEPEPEPEPEPGPAPAPGPTCAGACGSSKPVPGSQPACYCDAACLDYNDCCADAVSICGL
jgi:hypothetical protein